MQNYKAVISYDGTAYHGWQVQPKGKTIQGLLEKALEQITKAEISVMGAGRTDAGVHALAQTASFRIEQLISDEELFRAMNALLPQDIRIVSLEKAPPEFHALRSAKGKIYRYRIFTGAQVSPFIVRYVHHHPYPLDREAMSRAARLFVREADFNPFSSNRELYPVRRVTRSELSFEEEEIRLTISANGFLRYMVRAIVGTLMEVGRGRLAPDDIETLFAGKKRSLSSPTAPARGLCMLEVMY
jgi:tRNA pseudouridine38-40 synthase